MGHLKELERKASKLRKQLADIEDVILVHKSIESIAGITCYFDGGCDPNPGHASCGALVKRDGKTIWKHSQYIGNHLSNNVAEYAGVIAVLSYLLENKIDTATIYGDSNMVVQQMNRKWRAKAGTYLPYYKEALALRVQLPNVTIKWIPREKNGEADALAGDALSARHSSGRIGAQKTPGGQMERENEVARLVRESKEDDSRRGRKSCVSYPPTKMKKRNKRRVWLKAHW
jgi:ribonuclease HI